MLKFLRPWILDARDQVFQIYLNALDSMRIYSPNPSIFDLETLP
jgi:hypothetical protein